MHRFIPALYEGAVMLGSFFLSFSTSLQRLNFGEVFCGLSLIMGIHLVGEQNFFLYSKRLAFETWLKVEWYSRDPNLSLYTLWTPYAHLWLLQHLHHPLIHSPLHSIHNKCSYTTNPQATEKDTRAFCPVCLPRDLNRGHPRLLHLAL